MTINKFLEQKNILLVGDVHGHINPYWKILQKHNGPSIQLGDFGFKKQHLWHLNNLDSDIHKINFGNHDDYSFVNEEHSLGNWSVSQEIMTIRGAYSIDKYFRIKDLDWWENEELNYKEMQEAIGVYTKIKPKILITHECPQSVKTSIFNIVDKTLTSNGLQQMLDIHQPDLWIFGHHHKSISVKINNTKFICLNELETFLI